MILKVFGKISVSFGVFQILEISDLAMAKDKKVNIAVTYSQISIKTNHNFVLKFCLPKYCNTAQN